MKLVWTFRARDDLRAIGRYIARDSPSAAVRFVAQLRARAAKATQAPRASRVVPELGRDDVREVFVGDYRIVFRIAARELRVLCVLEGHRRMPDDLE